MSSGMTGQTPCLTSRWDKPAQSIKNAASNSAASQSPQTGDGAVTSGGVEKAAAMAAKINAMLMAKGKLMTPPPLLAKTPPSVPLPAVVEEMVITEVDINDVPINSRDLLTKGKTQEEIRQFSGAVVTTKGHYMTDAEKGKGAGQRPLYLHVQGKTQDQVNKAVMRIKEIISEELIRASAASGGQPPVMPPLTLYPQPPRPIVPPAVPLPTPGHRPAAPHTGSFVHTKIFVGLDQALPSFNVKEKVEGPSGAYLSHIQTETGARVFLRGKGSGYIEQASKRESFEPLYVYISHPNAPGLEAAKKLTESLLETVRAEHTRMTAAFPGSSTTQTYASHGYPPNSNYSNQGSWYNYPANGYAGGYSAYPAGYWSNANGPPSQSNLSTNPPSSQAMVQYPMCPRHPQPFVGQDPGSAEKVEPEGSVNALPDSGSPKRHFHEGSKPEQPTTKSPEHPGPASKPVVEKVVERLLMPPPPPPMFATPAPPRKRTRDADDDPTAAQPPAQAPAVSLGVQDEVQEKKTKLSEDASGLVPYGGDSSDEEDEKTHSSKT